VVNRGGSAVTKSSKRAGYLVSSLECPACTIRNAVVDVPPVEREMPIRMLDVL